MIYHYKLIKTGHFHLKQGNITINHIFMLHICTFNVKISNNRLLLLAYIYGEILATNEGGGGSPILTLTNKGEGGLKRRKSCECY